jgi:hypothetical protein
MPTFWMVGKDHMLVPYDLVDQLLEGSFTTDISELLAGGRGVEQMDHRVAGDRGWLLRMKWFRRCLHQVKTSQQPVFRTVG